MCGGSKGQQRSQQTTTTQAAPEAMAAYKDILTRAQEVAATPYQAYTGERVAGFTPYQEQAFGQIAGAQQAGMGTLGTAQQLAQAGAGPITASQIQTAMNPYQQAVVQSTMDELMRQEAIQQSALKGQAISAGAFGGDRAGVAAAELARNQEQVRAKTLAGLMQQGYSQAVAQAQADRAASQVGAGQMAALAQQQQAMPLTASSALAAAGAQQQQLEQQRLNVPYQTYLEQRAYPFQTQQWLAGLATGVGGAMGGTSQAQSVQTPAQPSPLNQILGAGLAVGSLALPGGGTVGGSLLSSFLRAEGGRVDGNIIEGTAIEIPEKADGGGLSVPAPTGMPYGGGFIPAATLQARPLQIASAPFPQAAPVTDPAKQFVGQAMDLAKSIRDAHPKPEMPSAESWQQGTSVIPAATGGRIHMADGGVPEEPPPITERQVEPTPGLAGTEYTAPAGEGVPSGLASASIPGRMGLEAAAQQPAETKGGFELSPEARQAMMQAGFALMASKSPWVGQAIGEAGMAGTQAYVEAQKLSKQLAAEQRELMKPVKIGSDIYGDIFAIRDPKDGTYHRIDPATGTVSGKSATTPAGVAAIDQPGITPTSQLTTSKGITSPRDADASLIGDEYLKQFTPEIQSAVKAYVEGRSIPAGNQRQPFNIAIKQIAQKYGDEIGAPVDDATFAARKTFRTQLSSSTPSSAGGQRTAANTALGHLTETARLGEELLNKDWYLSALSRGVNWARGLTTEQQAKVRAYENAVGKYTAEANKFYVGGPGGVHERLEARQLMNPYLSPRELAALLKVERDFVMSKAHAIEDQRDQVMGKAAKDIPIILPKTEQNMKTLTQTISNLEGGGSTEQKVSPPAQPSAVQFPPRDQREVGKTYQTPHGPLKWDGIGWIAP